MKTRTKTLLFLAAVVLAGAGCHSYQQQCPAYSYEENQVIDETKDENS
jgi:hypothetical protein